MSENTAIQWTDANGSIIRPYSYISGICSLFMTGAAYGVNSKPMLLFIPFIMIIFLCRLTAVKARQRRRFCQSSGSDSMIYSPARLFVKRLLSWKFRQASSGPAAHLTKCMVSVMPALVNSKLFYYFPCLALPAVFKPFANSFHVFFEAYSDSFRRYLKCSNSTTHKFIYCPFKNN